MPSSSDPVYPVYPCKISSDSVVLRVSAPSVLLRSCPATAGGRRKFSGRGPNRGRRFIHNRNRSRILHALALRRSLAERQFCEAVDRGDDLRVWLHGERRGAL